MLGLYLIVGLIIILTMVPLCLILDYTFYYSKMLRPYYEKHLKINNVSIFTCIILLSIIYAITWPVTTILILCGYILYVVSKKLASMIDNIIDYVHKNIGIFDNENQK
jgi:hypothetical protein